MPAKRGNIRRIFGVARIFVVILLVLPAFIACKQRAVDTRTITVLLDPGAISFDLNQELVREFEQQTGYRVRLLKAAVDSSQRLSQYLQYLGAESPDIDIYQVDVIWPATLEHHLLDLADAFTTESQQFLPALIDNNTVDGRLLAIPWYLDLPMLYYRTDLLAKHGFDQPPATWDELTTMAAAIQQAERAGGNPNIWGYVWQGMAYEGLTCNALEWQLSENGGQIVAPDGTIEVNTPGAIRAFERAADWVGTISPPGITMYAEEEARQTFQTGNAVFMRNWPYAFALVNSDDSPVRGNVATAPMPGGSGESAATLGGWQLAVSRYSRNTTAATELVRFMTGPRVQKEQAILASRLPTRTDLYADGDIARAYPFLVTLKDTLDAATQRPSAVTRADYNEVSTYYYQAVHQILTGQQTAAESLGDLDRLLRKILEP